MLYKNPYFLWLLAWPNQMGSSWWKYNHSFIIWFDFSDSINFLSQNDADCIIIIIIQLTNWILWNGKFYYRDVIKKKITITRAKGEGNGHFYHIEVIDLPFHTIPFVSCFISLIENTKKWTFIEIYKQIWDNLRASKFTGQSKLALRTTLALMRSCVRSQELCARTMTMEDAYQVKITLKSRAPNVDSNSLTLFWFYCIPHTRHFARHTWFVCIMTQNGRVTHGPWNSWWNYFMIMKWYTNG